MKILENGLSYSSEITHMLDYVEETITTLMRIPYDELNDAKLHRAVRALYKAASDVDDILSTRHTESKSIKFESDSDGGYIHMSNINMMLDQIEEVVQMLNDADDLNDAKLEKAVRMMYNGSDEVIIRLNQMDEARANDFGVSEYKTHGYDERTFDPFEESKKPVTEGYIEDRYLEVIKICNGTIDVAEYFGPSMNSVNNIRAGIVAIRNDLRSLKSGITGAAEHECKLNIRDEATIINRDIEKIDAMIGQLQRFKAQAIEAALEAKKVTAGVVVPR